MKTTCEKHSESLLLLVHNELSGWSRLQLEAHLLLCGECRARERRLRSLATTLASSLRNPSLGSRTFRTPKRFLWATLGLGAVSMVLVGSQLGSARLNSAAATHASGPHCEMGQGSAVVKHVPPPIPKPVPKSITETSGRSCVRQLR